MVARATATARFGHIDSVFVARTFPWAASTCQMVAWAELL
jgi:hypothetical protein